MEQSGVSFFRWDEWFMCRSFELLIGRIRFTVVHRVYSVSRGRFSRSIRLRTFDIFRDTGCKVMFVLSYPRATPCDRTFLVNLSRTVNTSM